MIKLHNRFIYFGLFLFSLLLLAVSFILQWGFHLAPCSLCMIDRVLIALSALLFVIALCHNPKRCGVWVYSILGSLFSLSGILATSRHLWLLQLPPDKVPECTPGLDYLLNVFPLTEVVKIILSSAGECAQQNHTFAGLSLPGWTLIAFILLLIGNFLPLRNKKQ